MRSPSIHSITRVSLFAALIAAGSYISIPLPGSPVPVVLANLFVVLSGIVLGPKAAAASVCIFLALGAVGLPVFSAGAGGLVHFAGPTGGYLVGYLFAAISAGAASRLLLPTSSTSSRRRSATTAFFGFIAALIGLAVVYIPGVVWMALILELDTSAALMTGLVPFIPGDLAKAAAAAAAVPTLVDARSFVQAQRRSVGSPAAGHHRSDVQP